jgi:hypothetical protein
MRFGFKDIFSIENPDQFVCQVIFMRMDHSVLALQVNLIDNLFNYFDIEFSTVRYYSGPLGWRGANFQIAPYEECTNILRRIPGFENYPTEEEAQASEPISRDDYYRLYLCGIDPLQVKIIAKHARIFEKEV